MLRDEADISKAESSTITVIVKMEPKKLRMNISKQKDLVAIKRSFLNSLLDEAPSSEELSEYSLYHNGEKLDETKLLGELEVSSYTFDCVRMAKNTIRVFSQKERQPTEIPFSIQERRKERDSFVLSHQKKFGHCTERRSLRTPRCDLYLLFLGC